ncbi:hypothetical protein V9T40_011139 [Parthenolecanium corni]|uniref:Uncharacterized protein n=1 Tax=Parthenolecanium corni TaxID=536013 RepID=A0AAN9T8Q8_9HEMI
MSTIPADPISCSIQQNDRNSFLQFLEELKKNRQPLPANDENWTALHYAASQPQYKEYLKLLLDYNDSILMDINGQTEVFGYTPLHIACKYGCEESVLILLQKGCDPYKLTSGEVETSYYEDTGFQQNGKFSALHIAAGQGNSKIIEYLLDYPQNINKPDKWRQTPLHRAAAGKSNSEVGRILFEKGADVRSIDQRGNLPLHRACQENNLDMIRFLVECDSTLINCTNNKGCTPLMLAAASWGSDVRVVRILCENGAKIDICDESGWTALHYAASYGKVEVLECILQYTETSYFEAWFSNKLNNVLNAGDYSLQCYHDINTQSFATFTNYESYYKSVIDEMMFQREHGTKLLKLILPNSVILEPDNLILLYHKFVNYYVSSDDAEELHAKRKYRNMHAYLTSLKPVYYKQPRKYDRYSFLSYPYNTIGEEFSNSTLKQLCRTVIRQHLREPTLEGYRQLLWTIWTEQYLLALRESKNIVGSRRATLKQPLEGDVELMVDPSLRRGFWRTAIIDRLIRSGDGQKLRRNDGSTMSTTSPSSGCFSVALLLPTIFLDSLRASKYCSVQIVQSSCRYPGLNSNTHTNEPPIPGTQFEYAY